MEQTVKIQIDEETVREFFKELALDNFLFMVEEELRRRSSYDFRDAEAYDRENYRPTTEAKAAVILKILD